MFQSFSYKRLIDINNKIKNHQIMSTFFPAAIHADVADSREYGLRVRAIENHHPETNHRNTIN